ncbi:hypothetical protein ACFRCI_27970, partial [Streptomyces sp. NPDC056638]|uniref:hypothetical protein n=1 Tax=Streptomyces sp. NPDC056638 TaxID=3345887 RepID=UPI0036D17DFA
TCVRETETCPVRPAGLEARQRAPEANGDAPEVDGRVSETNGDAPEADGRALETPHRMRK